MSTVAKTENAKSDTRANNAGAKKAPRAQRITKKQELIRLLSKKAGADLATLSEKFGWQPHTTRAALSGLRKTGYEVIRIERANGKPARYRIQGMPPEPAYARLQAEETTDAA